MNKINVLRGASGSGKSTLIKTLVKEYNSSFTICSADDYWYNGKEQILANYKFDSRKLGLAHKQCQDKFLEAIKNNDSLIIVDNTNINERDYKWYYLAARQAGYDVEFHTILPGTVDQHVQCNVHGVPKEAIERMIAGLKPVLKEINNEATKEIFYNFDELRNNK
jgi:predicted kinase